MKRESERLEYMSEWERGREGVREAEKEVEVEEES